MARPGAGSARPFVTREGAIAYRLRVNHLAERLPEGAYEQAARAGLQDTAPRDALLGMHARVGRCTPSAWEHPSLIQTYSPRAAVYVLPAKDFGIFTIGRLPLSAPAVQQIETLAEAICDRLAGEERRGVLLPGDRRACASGRLAVRWTTSALWVREVPRPDVDPWTARRQLCERHVHHFAPTTPAVFAWWAGLSAADARQIWNTMSADLIEVDFAGTRAWVLRADEQALVRAEAPYGTRFLVKPDLRLLGLDKRGLFVGPGNRLVTGALDSFHPNGIMIDGRIVGAWGRRGGQVEAVLSERLTDARRDDLGAEVATFPVAGARLRIRMAATRPPGS